MEKTLNLQSQYGGEIKVSLEINTYLNNGCMYIGLVEQGEYPEPYGDLTVNLMGKVPDYCGYVDLNNMPELEKFIADNALGEFTGLMKRSGYWKRQGNKIDRESEVRTLVIEINKDIDRYQETVALGLTARQLLFSVASVVVGGGLVLLLYKYIGLTGAAYVAIPCVAPIALGGFYSYNGMNFYEYMGKKLQFMFHNKALTYVSTESEQTLKAYETEQSNTGKKKQAGMGAKPEVTDKTRNKEDFEAMKRKTKGILIGMIAAVVAAVVGLVIYKATR